MIALRLSIDVAEFEEGRPFSSYELGESLTVALVLERDDLLQKLGFNREQAIQSVGPDWMAAVACVQEGRRDAGERASHLAQYGLKEQPLVKNFWWR